MFRTRCSSDSEVGQVFRTGGSNDLSPHIPPFSLPSMFRTHRSKHLACPLRLLPVHHRHHHDRHRHDHHQQQHHHRSHSCPINPQLHQLPTSRLPPMETWLAAVRTAEEATTARRQEMVLRWAKFVVGNRRDWTFLATGGGDASCGFACLVMDGLRLRLVGKQTKHTYTHSYWWWW